MQIEELKQAVIEEQHKNETCKFLEFCKKSKKKLEKISKKILRKFLDRLGMMLNKSIPDSANNSGNNSPSSTSSKKVDFSNILSLTT